MIENQLVYQSRRKCEIYRYTGVSKNEGLKKSDRGENEVEVCFRSVNKL